MATTSDNPSPVWTSIALALFCVVTWLLLWTGAATDDWPPGKVPNGFTSPVLAFEFAQSPNDVRVLLQTVPGFDKHESLTQSLHRDFGFMLAYMAFLVVLGWLFIESPRFWTFWVGGIVMTCAVLAAAADCIENCNLLELLSAGEAQMGPFLAALQLAVYTKWILLFLVTGLLGLLPLARPTLFELPCLFSRVNRTLRGLFAGVYAVVTVCGLSIFWKPQYIEKTSAIIAVAWLVIAAFLGFGLLLVLFRAWRRRATEPRA